MKRWLIPFFALPSLSAITLTAATSTIVCGLVKAKPKPTSSTKAAKRRHHTLYTQGGLKLLAHDNGKGYNAYLLTPKGKTFAKDGVYHLKGGGKIRVKGGVIIWSDPTADRRYPSNYRSRPSA
jgi:hypothetical protein